MALTSDSIPFTMNVEPAGTSNNNGNGMWGGDGAWWIVLFLIFCAFGGWGNGGFGNGFGGGNAATQGALTREQACIDNNFQNLMRETAGISDSVNLGFSNLNSTICSQQYDTARMINGLDNTVQGGFNSTNIAMLQGFNAIQAQAAQCCCDQKAATADLKYTIASEDCATRSAIQTGIRDVLENQNANARAVLDKLTQQELAAKDAQISALNNQLFRADLAASQTAQNQYLVNVLRPCPTPAYITCNPWAGQASYGSCSPCNVGCGCGNYGTVA